MGDDTYMGVPIITSAYMPPDKALVLDDKYYANLNTTMAKVGASAAEAAGAFKKFASIAGMSADFVVMDEWSDIEKHHLDALAYGNTGILRRAALEEMKRREQEQAELEATPGFGSF